MPSINFSYDHDGDIHIDPTRTERRKRRQGRRPHRQEKVSPTEVIASIVDTPDGEAYFSFSYDASRHERKWIIDSLGNFYDQKWVNDVLRLVKGGKEASVYLCSSNPELAAEYIAAKVYRPRQFRSLKNDHTYREGRTVLDEDGNQITDDGMWHAIQKRTAYGRQLMHTSWIEHEFQALEMLHSAGADVPTPYARGDNAILMSYIGAPGLPAPTLQEVQLPLEEAQRLFRKILRNIELMLAHDIIHGDLSAYNILYWEGEITLIDFPQIVSPRTNINAYRIFERDLIRVCEYFARQGVSSRPRQIAARLWSAYHHPLKPSLDPKYLDEENESDRQAWDRDHP